MRAKNKEILYIRSLEFPRGFNTGNKGVFLDRLEFDKGYKVNARGKFDFGNGKIDVVGVEEFGGGWIPEFIFKEVEGNYEIY